MLSIAYITLFLNFWQVRLVFGKWDFIFEYQRHRIWTGRSHIGGGHVQGPGCWMVLPRSWQDSFLHVFLLLCVFAIV